MQYGVKVKFQNAPRNKINLLHTHSIILSITCYIMLTTEVIKGRYFSNEVKNVKRYFLENTTFLFTLTFKKTYKRGDISQKPKGLEGGETLPLLI